MSCGPAEGLKKLAEKIDVINETIDATLTNAIDGVANLAVIASIKAAAEGFADGIKEKIKAHVPDFAKARGLISDIQDISEKILTLALSGQNLKDELQLLQEKYTGLNLGNLDLQNLPDLLRSGALDIEQICKLFPNFEEDGVDLVLRGAPVTFPEIDPVAIIRGHRLPELPSPQYGVDIQRRVREAGEEYTQVVNPSIFSG